MALFVFPHLYVLGMIGSEIDMRISVGDIVEVASGNMSEDQSGIVIEKREVRAKNVVGRGGFVEVISILLSSGVVYKTNGYTHNLSIIKSE